MSTLSWLLPSPGGTGPSSGTSGIGGPTGGGALARGSLSLVIDPITRDLIDSDDGWFVESADSRTAVLWQLEATYQRWWGDSSSGSRIREILAGDVPATAEDLRDETLRALQQLVNEGIISELQVVLDKDEGGRPAVVMSYRDRASGLQVDLAYVPFGG